MCKNIRDALDLTYYEQLHDDTLGYSQVTVRQYLDHLADKWCKINTTVNKKMKDHFYCDWAEDEHLTAYGARLTKERGELVANGITLDDDVVVEHYVLQMYKRGEFDRRDMTTYKAKPDNQKTFELTMLYFEGLVAAQEEFEQNAGGPNKRARYESAAGVQEASEKMGAEIRQYMESLASTKEKEQADKANLQEANELMLAMQNNLQSQPAAKDEQMKELLTQVAQLTANVVALTKKVTETGDGCGGLRKRTQVRFAAADKENQAPNAKATAGKDNRPPLLLKMSNMGEYCWSCGYNPVGKSHTRPTCKRKAPAPGHTDDAMTDNRMGGSEANKTE